jgi:septal ring factor EnvC (AmiA/AmiB activator)
LKALKGSAEEKQLTQRYTRQLDQQESQLEALRAEIAQFETKRDAARDQLSRMASELVLDVVL